MTTSIKRRRGTTAQTAAFIGAAGETTVDTTKQTVVVHDGATAGGFPLATENAPTLTGAVTLSSGTANGVAYLNGSKVLTSGSALTFNGSTLDVTGTVTADGLTVDGDGRLVTTDGAVLKLENSSTALTSGSVVGNLQFYANDNSTNATGAKAFIKATSETSGGTNIGLTLATSDSTSATGLSRIRIDAGGDVSFYEDTGTTAKFFWDASAESLGIGTNSPAAKLVVSESSATNFKALILRNPNGTTGSSVSIDFEASAGTSGDDAAIAGRISGVRVSGGTTGALDFFTTNAGVVGSAKMRLDSAGNLGLGVTPSAWLNTYTAFQLGLGGSIQGRTNTYSQVIVSANTYINSAGQLTYIGTSPASRAVQADGAHQWFNAPSGTADAAIDFGGAKMTLDASGRLLINRPAATGALSLEVQAPAGFSIGSGFHSASTQSTIEFKDSTTTANYKVRVGSAGDDLLLFAGGAERLRVDSAGNLGLGVAPSGWGNSFGVIQGLGGWSVSSNGANSNSADFASNAYRTGGADSFLYIGSSNATRYKQFAGTHQWYTAPSGTAGNAISFTQAMTLNSLNQLTIGNTSSAFDSTAYAIVGSGNSDSGLAIYTSNATAGYLQFADGTSGAEEYRGFIKYDHSTNAMSFSTNSTNRTSPKLIIDSAGNVGIGETLPDSKLEVAGPDETQIKVTGASGVEAVLRASASTVTVGSNTNHNLYLRTNNSARMTIEAGGNVGIGTISPTGKLSIAVGTYDSTTPLAQADDIVISGSQSLGMSFITTAAGSSNQSIVFGDSDDTDIGSIKYAHADNSMQFTTNATERARIDNAGHLIVPNGITLGTAVGTYAAANTLDDYEEGTWDFGLAGGTSAGTFSVVARENSYVKVGRTVSISGYIWATSFTGTGDFLITGLPFAAASESLFSIQVNTTPWASLPSDSQHITGITGSAFATNVGIRATSRLNGGTFTIAQCSGSGSVSFLRITGTYYTND